MSARSLESLQFPRASQVPKVPPKYPGSVLATQKPQIQLLLIQTSSCNLTENSLLSKTIAPEPRSDPAHLSTPAPRGMPSAQDTQTAFRWPTTTRFLQERREGQQGLCESSLLLPEDAIPKDARPSLSRIDHPGSLSPGKKSAAVSSCKPLGCQKQKGLLRCSCEKPHLSPD